MIVWLASYPRSGNGFLRAMVYTFYGYRSAPVSNIGRDRSPSLSWSWSGSDSFQEMISSSKVFFVKTHCLPADDTFPAVYLYRDGRDSLASYAWHALSKRFKLEASAVTPARYQEMLHELIVDKQSPYGTWSQNVAAWLARPNTATLRFEDFIRSPELITDAVGRLRLGLSPLPDVSVPTFEDLKNLNQTSFRRGKVGGWRDDFPPELVPLFWRHHGEMMTRLGYGDVGQPLAA